MKKNLFIFPLLLACAGFMFIKNNNNQIVNLQQIQEEKILHNLACAPDEAENNYVRADGKFIGVMPGWGNHSYKISTENDSAQFYFNQGLTLYFSYHAREAVASFKEASRFDNTCAMAYWGQALSLGPSYNGGYNYKMRKELPAVVEQMNDVTAGASAEEKDLITAMNTRYIVTDTTDEQRKQLNVAYADAMHSLVAKYA